MCTRMVRGRQVLLSDMAVCNTYTQIIVNVLVQLIRISAPGGEALQVVYEGRPHPLNDTLTEEFPADVT